jgi:hypothetical protein
MKFGIRYSFVLIRQVTLSPSPSRKSEFCLRRRSTQSPNSSSPQREAGTSAHRLHPPGLRSPSSSPVRTIRSQQPSPTRGRRPPPILGAPDPRSDRPRRRSHPKQRANHHAPGRQDTFSEAQGEAAPQQHRGALAQRDLVSPEGPPQSSCPAAQAFHWQKSFAVLISPKGAPVSVAMWRKPVENQPRASETMENEPDLASATPNTAPPIAPPSPQPAWPPAKIPHPPPAPSSPPAPASPGSAPIECRLPNRTRYDRDCPCIHTPSNSNGTR